MKQIKTKIAKYKKFLSVCLIVCLTCGLYACGDKENRQSKGTMGASPEETTENFFNALKSQDIETMLACCDIKDYYTDQFSFVEYIERRDIYSVFDFEEGAPPPYDCYRTLSEVVCRGNMATQIYSFMCSLTQNEQTIEDENITSYFRVGWMKKPDEATVTKFVESVNPSKLQNLDVIRIDRADQLYNYEQRFSTYENLDQFDQFDQYATIAILLKVDDNFSVQVLYSGKWMVHGLFLI